MTELALSKALAWFSGSNILSKFNAPNAVLCSEYCFILSQCTGRFALPILCGVPRVPSSALCPPSPRSVTPPPPVSLLLVGHCQPLLLPSYTSRGVSGYPCIDTVTTTAYLHTIHPYKYDSHIKRFSVLQNGKSKV